MTRRVAVVVAVASLVGVAEAGTKFKSSWKPPNASPMNFRGQKVAAVVMLNDEKTRNGIEDELAYALRSRNVVGVAAHTLLPPEALKDKEQARARLEEAGVAGAVVLRSVNKVAELSETPASYWVTNYYSFTDFYGWGWGGIYDPGYVKMDNVFWVETLVFDVKGNKLLWAALSETKNPKRADEFMSDLVSAAAKQLQKEGLVSK
jgi:hypothetical protein